MKNLRELAQQLGLKEEVDCFISYVDGDGYKHEFDCLYVEDDIYSKFSNNELIKPLSSLKLKKKGFYFEGGDRWKEMVIFDENGIEYGVIKDIGSNKEYMEFVEECENMENRKLEWEEGDIAEFPFV